MGTQSIFRSRRIRNPKNTIVMNPTVSAVLIRLDFGDLIAEII